MSLPSLQSELDAAHQDNQRLESEVDSLNARLASLSRTGANMAAATRDLPADHPVRGTGFLLCSR